MRKLKLFILILSLGLISSTSFSEDGEEEATGTLCCTLCFFFGDGVTATDEVAALAFAASRVDAL